MDATENGANPALKRLEDQATWFDAKSSFSRKRFQILKISQIVAGALIPFTASISAPAYIASALGVLIVVIEGLQSLNQYQQTWISYRSTCEQLKHEKYLWLAKAGPYASAANADAILAERVENILSSENASWAESKRKQEEQQPTSTANS
jgi:predicted signal transduction protein with EAL and GGDEF domain